MSRQTRLILILAAMALIAVVALGVMAERYSQVVGGPRDNGPRNEQAVDRGVEGFVRARGILREAVESGRFEEIDAGPRALAFAAARNRALSATGLEPADYRELREVYRRWTTEPARLDPVWRAALDRRRADLEGCGLGALEALDR